MAVKENVETDSGMTVQALFRQASPEKVIDAYVLLKPIFYKYEIFSVQEKLDKWACIRDAIRTHINLFQTGTSKPTEEEATIFILEYALESWEERGSRDFDIFSLKDEDVRGRFRCELPLIEERLTLAIGHYGIDMTPMEELAGYRMAGPSISEYGVEACCALILHEVFRFGYTSERRKENLDRLYEELDEAIKEFERSGKTSYISAEEMFQELLDLYDDEDEKQHRILEHEYQESVREIENRHMYKILEQNIKKKAAMIEKEYRARGF